MSISRGFADEERPRIAALYWEAFGEKLGRVMGPRARALGFLQDVMDPAHAITMRNPAGELLGLVGFKTYEGAFVGGGLGDMTRHYGRLGGTWRAITAGLGGHGGPGCSPCWSARSRTIAS